VTLAPPIYQDSADNLILVQNSVRYSVASVLYASAFDAILTA